MMDVYLATRSKYNNTFFGLRLKSIIIRLQICFIFLLFVLSSYQTLAKSRRPISDAEIREKKNQCYDDIESGLWGGRCKSSMVAKENCALRCLSPSCYELVYEGDPLEEGEKDIFRSQEYKYCMHKIPIMTANSLLKLHLVELLLSLGQQLHLCPLSMGETLEGIKGSFNY